MRPTSEVFRWVLKHSHGSQPFLTRLSADDGLYEGSFNPKRVLFLRTGAQSVDLLLMVGALVTLIAQFMGHNKDHRQQPTNSHQRQLLQGSYIVLCGPKVCDYVHFG